MIDEELSRDQVRQRAARGALSVFTRHAVVRLMAFAGTLVLARMLNPHTFGVFALSQFVLLLANAIAVGGVTTALTRRHEAVSAVEYRTAHALQQILALVTVVLLAAATPALAAAYDLTPVEALAFPVMGLAVFLQASRSIPTAALQRGLRHDLIAISEVVEYLVYVVVSVGLAYAGWGLWALVLATLLRYLVSTAVLYRMVRAWPAVQFDMRAARRIVLEALPQQLTILLALGQRGVNTAGVAAVLSSAAAGLVGMATTLLDSLVLQPLTLLAGIQFRLFARAQADPLQFRKLVGQAYFLSAAVCLPILIAAMLMFPALVHYLFPAAWAQTGYLVQMLSVASMFQVVTSPTIQALKAVKDLTPLMLNYVVSACIQLAALVILAPSLGLAAFAVANILGAGWVMAFSIYRLWTRTGRCPPLGSTIAVISSCAVASAAAVGLANLLPAAWQLMGVVAGVITYPIAVFLFAGGQVASHLSVLEGILPRPFKGLRTPIGRLASLAGRWASINPLSRILGA